MHPTPRTTPLARRPIARRASLSLVGLLAACGAPDDTMLELDTTSAEITAAGCTAGTVTACAAPLGTLVSRCMLAANTTFQVTTAQGSPAMRSFECKSTAVVEQNCATAGNILKACTLTAATSPWVTRRIGGSTAVGALRCAADRAIRFHADGYLNSCTLLADAPSERLPPIGAAAGAPIACKAGTVLTLSSTGYATTCTPTTDQVAVRPPPYATNLYKAVNCSSAGAMSFYSSGAASGYLASCRLTNDTNVATAEWPYSYPAAPCKAGTSISFGTNGRIKSCTLRAKWTTFVMSQDLTAEEHRTCPANGVAAFESELVSGSQSVDRLRYIGAVHASVACKLADYEYCDAHVACDSGLCELSTALPQCVPAAQRNGRTNGLTCLTNSNCLSSNCQDSGFGYSTCEAVSGYGEPCTINEHCLQGHCGLRAPDSPGYQTCGESNGASCYSDNATSHGPSEYCFSGYCLSYRCWQSGLGYSGGN